MAGRVSWMFGLLAAGCYLLPPLLPAYGHYHDAQAYYQAWQRVRPPIPRRPDEVMADVINDLGVRILQQYVEHGNVAFSPAGVGFILSALYEGSSGRSRQQITDCLGLPHERNIVRIGMRDIHRRLRTYLNPDGFLGGLNLNRENTTLRQDYENILRFYGFDLTIDLSNFTANASSGNFGLKSSMTTTQSPTSPVMQGMTTTTTTPGQMTTTMSPNMMMADGTPAPGTTPPADMTAGTAAAATMAANGVTMSAAATAATTITPAATTGTTTIDTSVIIISTTPAITTTAGGAPAAQTATTTTVSPIMTTMPGTTAGVQSAATIMTTTGAPAGAQSAATIMTTTGAPTTTQQPTTTGAPTTMMPSTNAALISTTLPRNPTQATQGNLAFLSGGTTTTEIPTSTTSMDMTTILSGADTTTMLSDTETTTILSSAETTTMLSGAETTTILSSAETTTILSGAETTTMADDIATVAAPTIATIPALVRRRRGRRRRRSSEYFSNYPDDGLWMQDLDIWADQAALPTNIRDATELQFLVNGCEVATVPAASYTAVLPFAYFPSLKAVALEFPLDNPRYNVLLFLPTERIDTGRLARELTGQSIRLLRRHLQPTWVRATIPSFMLRGFVTLTPYLQRLGIRDVFEPRLADLTPMTPDLGVYARDVQQSIAVNIRNYMKSDSGAASNGNANSMNMGLNGGATATNPLRTEPPLVLSPPARGRDAYRFVRPGNGLSDRFGLVSFTAEHPFLYFIVDTETSVSLIAGRIDDPLNSRIL